MEFFDNVKILNWEGLHSLVEKYLNDGDPPPKKKSIVFQHQCWLFMKSAVVFRIYKSILKLTKSCADIFHGNVFWARVYPLSLLRLRSYINILY